MQLLVDGQRQRFIPLQIFQAEWNLPETFNVAYFEPKDWSGLGSLKGGQTVLNQIRAGVLAAIPDEIPSNPALLNHIQQLIAAFERELTAANTQIGLRQVEIDFAVAGFADVLQAAGYHLFRLRQNNPARIADDFDFAEVYQSWLDNSARVASEIKIYQDRFRVQVIYNVYGRAGLRVQTDGTLYYVADSRLACPAWSYMDRLCAETAQALCVAYAR